MKTILSFLVPLLLLSAFSSLSVNSSFYNPAQQSDTLSYKIFKTKKCGWGYDIFIRDVIYIHQPTIPTVKGDKCFATKRDALETARLVIDKLRRGILLPVVTAKELDSLKVKQ